MEGQSAQGTSREKTKASLDHAKEHMPLGVAESYRYWGEKETVFVEEMTGCTLRDVDGKEYIDFRLGYGPIILGYRDPRVDQAVIHAITHRGTTCGFANPLDAQVVELIKELCPNIEKMRFANSGTEAVMGAVRTARGYTNRQKIVIIEGGFHGLYDEMMWRTDLENWSADEGKEPAVIPYGIGLSALSRELMDIIPLNSFEALDDIFAEKGEEIAAVVIEPIMGNCGSIEATPEYMKHLRGTCDKYGSMLIIDEVKSGFRVAKGGVQAYYGVQADLTTYAKAMGNGYPIAAFGGRAEVMDKIFFGKGGVVHGGTYTANLIGISAAKATLEILTHTDALQTAENTGQEIMKILGRVFSSFGLPYTFAGPGTMFGIHLSESVPQNYRDWKSSDNELYTRFAKNLIQLGIMLEPDSREPWFLCEAHAKMDLGMLEDKCQKAMKAAVDKISL